jgi:hypothetical protein
MTGHDTGAMQDVLRHSKKHHNGLKTRINRPIQLACLF